MPTSSVSVVIPAKNEAAALAVLLPRLTALYPDYEIIVVNDGSTDNTSDICSEAGVKEIRHAYSVGNGAAIKHGARAATGDFIVFMDGDGQHQPEDIKRLVDELLKGYDMVVGSRAAQSQASVGRLAANTLYNRLASWMVGHRIDDLTSGFRAVRAGRFREFLHLLPNGFSYPTTSTMAFFRAGYLVKYVPVTVLKRNGKSHVSLMRDGVRFLLIIFKIGTLYSPLKLFTPISFLCFLTGFVYYGFTFYTVGRFTNMSALLFSTSIIVFLMGLVSEQIAALQYQSVKGDFMDKNTKRSEGAGKK